MTFVSQFDPKELWQHFDKILTIPRGSKNEAAMREYVISIAKKHGLDYQQDAAGNLVVRKPATKGSESAPITILQCHLDMVNEKNADVQHDFTKDAIKPRQEGDYLYATGTTLGSDNGIGVAAALAIMENQNIQHGPLELLFTIDEETGLTGAANLSSDLLKGRRLINLDTEEEGSLYVGCAGGAGVNITLPLKFSDIHSDSVVIEIKLHGLNGGHSGVDIHLQRGNAIKLLGRALNSVYKKVKFQIANFSGGNMHNAIPREAFAQAAVAASEKDRFQKELYKHFQEIYEEFKPADPEMKLAIADITGAKKAFDSDTTARVLNLINALPHGVASMSYDIPGLVETSSNLATVKIKDSEMVIHVSNRSSAASAIRATQERIASIGQLAGAKVEELEGYPGWKPNMDSQVLRVAKTVHEKLFGKEPKIKAIHAGLECGIIGEKFPGMDMVSLGPQIEFPHSPKERVRIGSVAKFYKFLIGVLEELAKAS